MFWIILDCFYCYRPCECLRKHVSLVKIRASPIYECLKTNNQSNQANGTILANRKKGHSRLANLIHISLVYNTLDSPPVARLRGSRPPQPRMAPLFILLKIFQMSGVKKFQTEKLALPCPSHSKCHIYPIAWSVVSSSQHTVQGLRISKYFDENSAKPK